jgi:hypothetical protein
VVESKGSSKIEREKVDKREMGGEESAYVLGPELELHLFCLAQPTIVQMREKARR